MNNFFKKIFLSKVLRFSNKKMTNKDLIYFNTNGIKGRGGKVFYLYNINDKEEFIQIKLKSKKYLNFKIYESIKNEKTESDFKSTTFFSASLENGRKSNLLKINPKKTYKVVCGGAYPYVIKISKVNKNNFEVFDITYDWEIR